MFFEPPYDAADQPVPRSSDAAGPKCSFRCSPLPRKYDTLTTRHKWKTRQPCIACDDIVLVRDKQVPRNDWPMGRVVDVKKSPDNLVRSVTLKMPSKAGAKPRYLTRPITELVLLIPSKDHSPTCTETGSGGNVPPAE